MTEKPPLPRLLQPADLVQDIQRRIYIIRGQRVMLDKELAALYGVPTKALKQAVRRNASRFPKDFMFLLAPQDLTILRSQTVTSRSWGGERYPPMAFTEQGVAMLSSVLNTSRAIQVNIQIMRAFVRLREILSTHKDLARKLEELEKRYDSQFRVVFDAIRQLMAAPVDPPRPRIGFHPGASGGAKEPTLRICD
jgi:hypothetical protein